MSFVKSLSVPERAAQYLRAEIIRGRWAGTLPGKTVLAAELGINHQTVDGALQLLEKEGLLLSQGPGRPRLIISGGEARNKRALRVALLLWDKTDRSLDFIMDLQHRLTEAGHSVINPSKTLLDLKMDVGRVAHLVEQTEADAWVVMSGSAEVMEWFSQQKFPTLAIFGRYQGLPIASVGPSKQSPIAEGIRSLIELGHRRIVLLIRRQHRLPQPGTTVNAFLKTLEVHGIKNSSFTLPDWDESAKGLQACLESLFRDTPPTALIVDELLTFTATCQFLAARRLRVPQDVSLISTEFDSNHDWCAQSLAHFRWDFSTLVRQILRWAKNISQGKKDVRQYVVPAEYVPGGTVGRAPMKADER